MKELTCSVCGSPIYLTNETYRHRLEDGATFYCPNGHAQVFAEPVVKRLQGQIDYLRQRVKSLEKQNATYCHAINGYKGQLANRNNKIRVLEYHHNNAMEAKVL